jgi:hypothetical protein
MTEIFEVLFLLAVLASHLDTHEPEPFIIDVRAQLSLISAHKYKSGRSGAQSWLLLLEVPVCQYQI